MANWKWEKYIIRSNGGEAIGLVTIIRPDDSATIQFSILNRSGTVTDLVYTIITQDAEYDTAIEFGMVELDVLKEGLSNTGMNYSVLLSKPKVKPESS